MPVAYRIVKTRFARRAMEGKGASLAGGRWNSPGRPMVYTSDSRALAMLEILAHLSPPRLLNSYSLARIEFEGRLVESVAPEQLPGHWRESPVPVENQQLGDDWLDAASSCILKIPSAIVPDEFNYLLNPQHPDFKKISVSPFLPIPFDPRLK